MSARPAASSPAPGKKPFPFGRAVAVLLVLVALFAVFRFLPVARWIEELKAHVRGRGVPGAVVFGLVYIGASLVPGGPAAILTLAAGAVYGVVTGTLLVSLASTTAATAAFLLARGAFRAPVERLAAQSAAFASLNRAIGREGARIVALVRLSPAFPFTIVNYLFGLTPLRLLPYVLSSWVAMLPGTLAYVWVGSALGEATGASSPLQKASRSALAAAAVVATLLVARVAAKAIRRAGVGG